VPKIFFRLKNIREQNLKFSFSVSLLRNISVYELCTIFVLFTAGSRRSIYSISDIGELQLPVFEQSRVAKLFLVGREPMPIVYMAVMLHDDVFCNICIYTTELALVRFLSIRKPILSRKDKNSRFLLLSSFIIV
jgi:hypothetical protein